MPSDWWRYGGLISCWTKCDLFGVAPDAGRQVGPLFLPHYMKRQRRPLHSSVGLHRTSFPAHLWSGAYRSALCGLPWPGSVCCLCSPSHGLELQMERLCLARGVRHTPPLILPSESLQRTMANICELPKCSSRKKRPVGKGGREGGRCGILKLHWMRASSAICLRMSVSRQCLGYVSCCANGRGVMSPVLDYSCSQFSPRTDWVHTRTHTHTETRNTQAS